MLPLQLGCCLLGKGSENQPTRGILGHRASVEYNFNLQALKIQLSATGASPKLHPESAPDGERRLVGPWSNRHDPRGAGFLEAETKGALSRLGPESRPPTMPYEQPADLHVTRIARGLKTNLADPPRI